VKELAAFAEAQKAPYRMLSDPDGSVAAKYGVLDPSGKYAQRVTFVLDEQGVLRTVLDKVDVKTHGEDLAVLIDELKQK
jgi:peroxiredoxin Q/BCP